MTHSKGVELYGIMRRAFTMFSNLIAGFLAGCGIGLLVLRGKVTHRYSRSQGSPMKRPSMQKNEQQVLECMRELSQSRPETSSPDKEFLRSWAYGNAGLEDERITVEQVDNVLRVAHK